MLHSNERELKRNKKLRKEDQKFGILLIIICASVLTKRKRIECPFTLYRILRACLK